MKLKELILSLASKEEIITTRLVMKHTDATPQGINKALKQLTQTGKLVKYGVTRSAYYLLPEKVAGKTEKTNLRLSNRNLQEHEVFLRLRKGNRVFAGLPDNLESILDYAFSEMLNNAIEHSFSKTITITWQRTQREIAFEVSDAGIGIFRSIRDKKGLSDELAAIQELLKGKVTTMPQAHSGQGIFFTSRIADLFVLESFGKRLTRDNRIDDIFLEDTASKKRGTRVSFTIDIETDKHLSELFHQYSHEDFEFDTTDIHVKLYQYGTVHVSRSQARRILTDLEKFTRIILDFKGVPAVGQAFADEIFRVWQLKHPDKIIEYRNANENVEFMILRSGAKKH